MTTATPPQMKRPTNLLAAVFDIRVIGVLFQIAFVIAVVIFFGWVGTNTAANINQLGEAQFICANGNGSEFRCLFDFMNGQAGFALAEDAVGFTEEASFWRALGAGAVNTLIITTWGIILTTIWGTFVGIARLSDNWLVAKLAQLYVDFFRNTPLVLQLVFIYFTGFLAFLPQTQSAAQLFALPVFLSNAGLQVPNIIWLSSSRTILILLIIGIIVAIALWRILGNKQVETGKNYYRGWAAFAALLVFPLVGWLIASANSNTNLQMLANNGVNDLDSLTAIVSERLGGIEINEIEAAIASGQLSADQVEDAGIAACGLRDSKATEYMIAQLQGLGVPFTMRPRNVRNLASNLADGDCDLVVGTTADIGLVSAELEDAAAFAPISLPEPPAVVSTPQLSGLGFIGGRAISSTAAALLIGLVLNTGASVAEIVRAGIQSVSKGQSEAASALGLSSGQRLRLIILPQALQVIIPPQTSQYLNLAKNSTLGIAIAYPEIFAVSQTIINQSGRALQVLLIVMLSFLTLSLLISAFLNWYNSKIVIRER